MIFQNYRRQRRNDAGVMVKVRIDDREGDAMLANASSRGLLAIMNDAPGRGSRVKVEIGERTIYGRVRWSHSDRCGVLLEESIRVPDLIEGRVVPYTPVTQRDLHRLLPDLGRTMVGDGPIVPRALRLVLLAAFVGGASYTIARFVAAGAGKEADDASISSGHWG
jgi:hypothetical protein